MRSRPPRALTTLVATVAAAGLLTGCGELRIPADPDGTLEQVVTSKTLRVGVSVQPPYTTPPTSTAQNSPPGGTEVELIDGFARSLGAEPVWVIGGEESLVTRLEEGQVHVLIGGLTAASPWGTQVALTRPYATTAEGGEPVDLVIATVPGENALLSALERYLDEAGS